MPFEGNWAPLSQEPASDVGSGAETSTDLKIPGRAGLGLRVLGVLVAAVCVAAAASTASSRPARQRAGGASPGALRGAQFDELSREKVLLSLAEESDGDRTQNRFSKADLDGSGFIDNKKEFQQLIKKGMKKLGIDKATAQQLLKDADLDADEKLSPEEYKALDSTANEQHGQKRLPAGHDNRTQHIFSKADLDGSGFIDNKKEFQQLIKKGMQKLGIDKASAQQLLKDADVDADEKLSPEEYKALDSTANEQHGQKRLLSGHDNRTQHIFSKADLDDSGFIDNKKEFQQLIKKGMKKMGIDKATAQQLLKDADLDADEKLSPEEYKALDSTANEQHGQKPLLAGEGAGA